MFTVKFSSYSGLSWPVILTTDDREEARQAAVNFIKKRRKEYAVCTVEKGQQWEILEPEDCHLVPDDCGFLWIDHEVFHCGQCGSAHETREESYRCCEEDNDYLPELAEDYAS